MESLYNRMSLEELQNLVPGPNKTDYLMVSLDISMCDVCMLRRLRSENFIPTLVNCHLSFFILLDDHLLGKCRKVLTSLVCDV